MQQGGFWNEDDDDEDGSCEGGKGMVLERKGRKGKACWRKRSVVVGSRRGGNARKIDVIFSRASCCFML